MEQNEFDEQFSELEATLDVGPDSYRFANAVEIWENIGSASLDKFFIGLAELYLDSNDKQRQTLYEYCGQKKVILENLWYFIRRIGVLIYTGDDKRWLDIGIACAILDGGRVDPRDLIVSLVLLRYFAEEQKIDAKGVFDKFIQSAEGGVKGILENAQNYPKSSIRGIVHSFGPPKEQNHNQYLFIKKRFFLG